MLVGDITCLYAGDGFADSSGESSGENGRLDNKCNSCVNDFDVFCRDMCLELNRMMELAN